MMPRRTIRAFSVIILDKVEKFLLFTIWPNPEKSIAIRLDNS